jgi:low affinity Fe/Cu permease
MVMTVSHGFTRFAKATARASGRPATFGLAVLVIVVWAVTGPVFHFSDTWQLVINTGTTVVTFLMVFLIQNTQNRDSIAMQIKLDELLRAMKGAETAMADLEDLTDAELVAFQAHYAEVAAHARSQMRRAGALPFGREQLGGKRRGRRARGRRQAPSGEKSATGKAAGSGKADTNASTATGSS